MINLCLAVFRVSLTKIFELVSNAYKFKILKFKEFKILEKDSFAKITHSINFPLYV